MYFRPFLLDVVFAFQASAAPLTDQRGPSLPGPCTGWVVEWGGDWISISSITGSSEAGGEHTY